MDAKGAIEDLALTIYEEPLSQIRDEPEFPNLDNPLHMIVLLLDCDTEVAMNGVLGFLENLTGRHLGKTIEALERIGAPKSAELLRAVQSCMDKHGVTWARLRGDFEVTDEYQITSFRELHGESLSSFSTEVCQIAGSFQLFNNRSALEDAYGGLCRYTQNRFNLFQMELHKRKKAG
jgi:hypothetical protein